MIVPNSSLSVNRKTLGLHFLHDLGKVFYTKYTTVYSYTEGLLFTKYWVPCFRGLTTNQMSFCPHLTNGNFEATCFKITTEVTWHRAQICCLQRLPSLHTVPTFLQAQHPLPGGYMRRDGSCVPFQHQAPLFQRMPKALSGASGFFLALKLYPDFKWPAS